MNLATAELLDGLRPRERIISAAGEGIGGAEGRGDERCPADEMPRSAEVEAPLEDPGRAREIPAAEVSAPEINQPAVQCEGMIGRFSDPHAASPCPIASSNRPS